MAIDTGPLAYVSIRIDAYSFRRQADSLPRSAANRAMSGADSSPATNWIRASVLLFGHSANSAQPRNFEAASSKVIGSAGLPLPKIARPEMTLPFLKVILMMEVILSNP